MANNLGPIACWAEQVIVTYFEQPLLATSYFIHLLFLHYVLPTYVCLPMMSTNKLHYVMPVIKECDSELAYTRLLLTLLCGQLTTHSSMACMRSFAYSEALVPFLAYDDK